MSLEHLKESDNVTVCFPQGISVEKVMRVTKTQFITNSGKKFNRKSGYAIGGGYFSPHARETTEEDLLKTKILNVKRNIKSKTKNIELQITKNVDIDVLTEVDKMLTEVINKLNAQV